MLENTLQYVPTDYTEYPPRGSNGNDLSTTIAGNVAKYEITLVMYSFWILSQFIESMSVIFRQLLWLLFTLIEVKPLFSGMLVFFSRFNITDITVGTKTQNSPRFTDVLSLDIVFNPVF